MLKKLVPAVLGALLIASPVFVVTTAVAQGAATAQKTETSSMKTHHKAAKHKKASHHAWKKHSKAKKAPSKG